MNTKKTLIAISTAMALGIIGAGSAAWAGDSGENHQDEDGARAPQFNHPVWSGNSASGAYGYGAYGYVVTPTHQHRPVHEQTKNR